MIDSNNLTQDQIKFLLYAICDESYEKMAKLSATIDHICMTCNTLWVEEIFQLMGMPCPPDLKNYGWSKPRRYLDDGYFYLYLSGGDEEEVKWHVEFPMPERLPR